MAFPKGMFGIVLPPAWLEPNKPLSRAGVYYTPPRILKDSSRTPRTPQDSSGLLKNPQDSLRLLQNSSNSPQGLPGLLKDSLRTPPTVLRNSSGLLKDSPGTYHLVLDDSSGVVRDSLKGLVQAPGSQMSTGLRLCGYLI